MAVWDFLKNALNIGNNEAPKIEPVLIGDAQYKPATKLDRVKDVANLGLSKLKDSKLYQGIAGIDNKIENAFFGKLIDNPVENTTITQDNNGNTTISSGVGTPTREGGIINDFVSGARENYTTGFNPQNLMSNNKKGFVYRLGEGLGTIGRMLESPLGRGLAVAGAVGALGGSAGDALAYGLGTTAGNQQLRGADRLYRDSLIKAEQDSLIAERNNLLNDENFKKLPTGTQQQYLSNISDRIDAVANRYNNVKGYISPQSYNAMLQAKQLQDNAEWRKANLLTQQAQQRALEDYRNKQLQYDWAELNQRGQKSRTIPSGSVENLSSTYQGLIQMRDLMDKLPKLPKRLTTPGVAQASAINPFDTDAQAFNQYVKTYKQVIGKGLEGGVLRKEDEYKYDQIIPKVGDTAEVLKQKAEQLNQMLLNKYNSDLEFLEMAGYNTADLKTIETPRTTQKTNTTSGTFVQMKAPNGRIYKVPIENVEEMKKQGGVVING